jgi:DNA-binding FrmR family transcriptional regulator
LDGIDGAAILLAEVVEGHVREHVAAPGVSARADAAAEELVDIVRTYVR